MDRDGWIILEQETAYGYDGEAVDGCGQEISKHWSEKSEVTEDL